MLSGRSTQHILQMLKNPQSIEYHIVTNRPHFSRSIMLEAKDQEVKALLQKPMQTANRALETILQQVRQFA